jgi:hypothetical protein
LWLLVGCVVNAAHYQPTGPTLNKEASHYVNLFGGYKIGNLIF